MNKFKKFIYTAICMSLPAFVFTACGDDDDEPYYPGQGNHPVSPTAVYTVDYEAEVSRDYLEFFDVTVTRTTADGNVVTEMIPANGDYEAKYRLGQPVGTVVLSLHTKVKPNHPQIDPNRVYRFEWDCEIELFAEGFNRGKTGNQNKLSVKGD